MNSCRHHEWTGRVETKHTSTLAYRYTVPNKSWYLNNESNNVGTTERQIMAGLKTLSMDLPYYYVSHAKSQYSVHFHNTSIPSVQQQSCHTSLTEILFSFTNYFQWLPWLFVTVKLLSWESRPFLQMFQIKSLLVATGHPIF